MAMQTLDAIELLKPMTQNHAKSHAVRIFAGIREAIGADQVMIEIEPETRAGEIKAALARRYPQAAELIRVSRLAVCESFVGDEETIGLSGNSRSNTLEMALIPPVSGG
ncbi:MAG: MoaD/ThiS family protein [Planctomycetota bacterium]|nr:MAG: MoaD/ThiS family protein [Planctomycetota bacterium]